MTSTDDLTARLLNGTDQALASAGAGRAAYINSLTFAPAKTPDTSKNRQRTGRRSTSKRRAIR